MNESDIAARQLQAELAIASHNLREPLRMIRCYVDLLADQPEESAMCVERISHGAGRLEALINGMFECFQLSEYVHPERTSADLALANAITRLAPADRTAVSAAELPHVSADFEILTEVFSRLIDNALKYRSQKPPAISVTATQTDDLWEFVVADNGIGVEEADWERCFGMFKRLHGREVPGEGFGLAYCRRAIQFMDGRIWMTSVPGAGTQVHFTLPAV